MNKEISVRSSTGGLLKLNEAGTLTEIRVAIGEDAFVIAKNRGMKRLHEQSGSTLASLIRIWILLPEQEKVNVVLNGLAAIKPPTQLSVDYFVKERL